jgi:hypothetical protein
MSTCNASCADTAFSHSSNLAAANAHLSQLLPLTQTSDPDLSHQISLLEIALLMHPSRPDLPSAYRKIASLLANTSDLAQTLHLLTLKAAVFAAAGKPEKGFSIAVRAASRAERAGLVPVLLEALAALAEILNKVGEFGAARELAEAALPQVCLLYLGLVTKVFGSCGPVWKYPLTSFSIKALESGTPDLSARFFLLLTSSCAGLANPDITTDETTRVKFLRQATRWVERARESKCDSREITLGKPLLRDLYCDALVSIQSADKFRIVSSRLEDFSAQQTALMMKAALAAELGDDAGVKEAEDWEAQLVRVNEESLSAR